MRALFISAATAAVGGMLMGAAIRPKDADLHDNTLGPQIVAASAWEDEVAPSPISYRRAGALPDYVIGTDWSRPKLYEAPIAAVYETPPEPHTYAAEEADVAPVSYAAAPAMAVEPEPRLAPRPVSYPSIAGDVIGPARSALDSASDAVESLDDGRGERAQVISVDDQGRGQIDQLAHGSDPYALIGEPSA